MAEDWLKSSIMAKRAVAKGAAGARHSLTIEQQGSFHYVYGSYAKPTLSIDPGGMTPGRSRLSGRASGAPGIPSGAPRATPASAPADTLAVCAWAPASSRAEA